MSKNKENPFSYKSADDATGFLLYKVYNKWQREIKRNLKELDLTHTQYVILATTYWLIFNQKQVTQIEIAKQAELDVMMTSNVLRTLEKKKIVKRIPHDTDTRAKLITITDSGEELLKKAIVVVESFDRMFFSKLDDSKQFNAELIELIRV